MLRTAVMFAGFGICSYFGYDDFLVASVEKQSKMERDGAPFLILLSVLFL